jgi:hypothetical protein
MIEIYNELSVFMSRFFSTWPFGHLFPQLSICLGTSYALDFLAISPQNNQFRGIMGNLNFIREFSQLDTSGA